PGGDALNKQLGEIAATASEEKAALDKLIKAMGHEDAAIRYWGATGIGNMASDAGAAEDLMVTALQDESVSVRVAAARALCLMSKPEKALEVLIATLSGEHPWGRLQAAIVLDGIGEQARPAQHALKKALTGQPNKYITRVANHALNVMNRTSNTVK
ncbi:MAG: HEAT repeat domain-containing protein, partial [Planctomycetes bacterium]|nr:HEAT repeat domain-containing protein [Planctomycetota bacterium]